MSQDKKHAFIWVIIGLFLVVLSVSIVRYQINGQRNILVTNRGESQIMPAVNITPVATKTTPKTADESMHSFLNSGLSGTPIEKMDLSNFSYKIPIAINSTSSVFDAFAYIPVSYELPSKLFKYKDEKPDCVDPDNSDKLLRELYFMEASSTALIGPFNLVDSDGKFVPENQTHGLVHWDYDFVGAYRFVLLLIKPQHYNCGGKGVPEDSTIGEITLEQYMHNVDVVGIGYSVPIMLR